MNNQKTVIKLENISFKYNSHHVLENINLEIHEKDFLAIIGPNGSGKSTLVKIILGLLKAQKGKVEIFGKNPFTSSDKIGYLPQGNFFDPDFPLSVKDVVLYGLINKNSFSPFFHDKEKKKTDEILKKMNIYKYKDRKIGNLSGGQKQRVFIARALINNPEILILDEPGTHIDSNAEKELYELLRKLNKEITVIMVSHDVSVVSKYTNKVACVNRNIVVNNTKDLLHNKTHPHSSLEDKISINHTCKL